MSDWLNKKIRQSLEQKSTVELRQIAAEQDRGEWSDDAVQIAGELLAERPVGKGDSQSISHSPNVDQRGQSVFALTPAEITDYRSKIQFFGWILCLAGAVAVLVFFSPMMIGGVDPGSITSGVLGIVIGLLYVRTGRGLIRLDPKVRFTGIVLSVILLPFFPIGTIAGVFGVLWLGKRGGVMVGAPGQMTEGAGTEVVEGIKNACEDKES